MSNIRINGLSRIGPHPLIILSIIYGSLLGDAHAERRLYKNNNELVLGNTRISFKQGSPNVQYLLHNWKIFSSYSYCSLEKPKLLKTISKLNKVYYYSRFHTWTFSSFNYIHDIFYKNNKKILPSYDILFNIIDSLALATWIMDDGSKNPKSGLILHTDNFDYNEVLLLCKLLETKFNILAYPRLKNKDKNQWLIYIPKIYMPLLINIVSKHFSLDMMRKLIDS